MLLKFIKITGAGESHGKGYTGIIEGLPSGLQFSMKDLQTELDRRKPGGKFATARKETDQIEFISGVKNSTLTGAPLCFFVPNHNQQSKDYDILKDYIRPGHADLTRRLKYKISHHEGGGLFSARWTILYIVAGYFSKLILAQKGITVQAYVSQIGSIQDSMCYTKLNSKIIEKNSLRMMDKALNAKAEKFLTKIINDKTSIGSQVTIHIDGVPPGVGIPHTHKLNAHLSFALYSIPAVQCVSFGNGLNAPHAVGHEFHDLIESSKNKEIKFKTNHSGGILGGLSTGNTIIAHIGLKPPSSFSYKQKYFELSKNKSNIFSLAGRFDPVLGPRCVPVAEGIVALYMLNSFMEFHAENFI